MHSPSRLFRATKNGTEGQQETRHIEVDAQGEVVPATSFVADGFDAGTCRAEPHTASCHCNNEGSGSVGNHCAKMSGAALTQFQNDTQQDFSTDGTPPDYWCVCLHLWGSHGKPSADTSACSATACTEVGGCSGR